MGLIRNLSIFGAVLFFLILGCTRKQDETASVKLTLPAKMTSAKMEASQADVLSFVIINITLKDKNEPIYINWDACLDCPMPDTTHQNGNFELKDIPVGNDHLFQIVAVYQNPDTGLRSIYYGDATANLGSSSLELPISVSLIGGGTQVTDGQISGRYLTSISSGPTAPVDIYLKPKPDRPAVLVEKSAMYNGWFSFFSLSGVPLRYVLKTAIPEVLFGGEVSLNSSIFDPGESAAAFDTRMRAYLPVHLATKSNSLKQQEPTILVWGFWGPGVSTQKVCAQGMSLSPATTKIKKYAASSLESSPGLIVDRLLVRAAPVPTEDELWNKITPSSSIKVKGGANMLTNCGVFADTDANRYNNFIKVSLNQIDGGGKDQAAGFRTFLHLDGSLQPFSITGIPKVISGQVLPGILSEFDQVKLFKRIGGEDFKMEAPNCEAIASGAHGFVAAGSAVIAGDRKFTLSSSINAADVGSGVTAVLCLAKNEQLGKVGVFIRKDYFSGSGFTQVLANNYDFNSHGFNIDHNQCHRAYIRMVNGSNYSTFIDDAKLFNASISGVTGQLSLNPDCSSAASTISVTVNPGENFKEIYYKTSAGTSGTISVTSASFGSPFKNVAIDVSSAGSLDSLQLSQKEIVLQNGDCRMVDLFFTSNGSPATTKTISGDNIAASLSGAVGADIFPNDGCSGVPLTSTALAISSEFYKRLYVKSTSSGIEIPISIGLTAAGISTTLIVNPAVYAHHVALTTSYPSMAGSEFYGVGECIPLKISAVDSSNVEINAPKPSAIDFSVGSSVAGSFYSSQTDCDTNTNPHSNSINTFVGPVNWFNQTPVYFKPLTSGINTIAVTTYAPRISNPDTNKNYIKTIGAFSPAQLPSLIGWYKVNYISNLAAASNISYWDVQGSAAPLNVGGGPATVTASSVSSPWKTALFERSSNAYYSSSAIGISEDYTIAMRIKFTDPTASSDDAVFQIKDSLNCNWSYLCGIKRIGGNDGRLKFGTGYITSASYADSLWHTVVVSRNFATSRMKIYVDGALEFNQIVTSPYDGALTSPLLNIGKNYDGGVASYFDGQIGDILVYSQDLSANQNQLHDYLNSKFPN